MFADLSIHALFGIGNRNLIDIGGIFGRNNVFFTDIAEQGDFAFFVLRDIHLGAAEQHIRLNAVFLKFFYRMLGRLGF